MHDLHIMKSKVFFLFFNKLNSAGAFHFPFIHSLVLRSKTTILLFLSLQGPSRNPGINQRALNLLFEETRDRGVDWDFTLNVSVLEIYNEMLRDLLGDDPSAKLDIRQGTEGLFVPGLTEIQVNDVDELNEVGVTVWFEFTC